MKTVCAVLGLIALAALPGLACECAPLKAPCAYVGYSDQIFIGKVIGIESQPTQFDQIRMEVERVYKGTATGVVVLYDTRMCDGPLVKVGGRYLMYTSGDPKQSMPLRGCTRSRAVEEADEDIAFLELYAAGVVVNSMQVQVRYVDDPKGDREDREEEEEEEGDEAGPDYPAAGVTVEIARGEDRRRGRTDRSGRVVFTGLEAGNYKVNAEKRGYLPEQGPAVVELKPLGCAEAELPLVADLRVQGTLRSPAGLTLEGVPVDLEPAAEGPGVSWLRPYTTRTDRDGRFEFAGVRPGYYHLGVNLQSLPSEAVPYPATWFPGVASKAGAETIEVGPTRKRKRFDLPMGEPLVVREFEVRLELADGSAVPEHWRPFVQIVDPRQPATAFASPSPLDGGAPARLRLCEGVRYIIVGGLLRAEKPLYSAPVEVIPAQSDGLLRLVLDRGSKAHEEWLRELMREHRLRRPAENRISLQEPR